MSFVTAQSPALLAAADKLQHLGTAMAAQNAAMATPTANVVPAAADGVSALQAMQFSAYGTWYHQVSQQAEVIHQMLVNTLGSNAGSYGEAESTNQATTGSNSLTGLLNALAGGSPAAPGDPALSSSSGAGLATAFNGLQNFGAASSDMFDLSQGQYAPEAQAAADSLGIPSDAAAVPATTSAVAPVGGAGLGAMPVTAGVGSGLVNRQAVGAADLDRQRGRRGRRRARGHADGRLDQRRPACRAGQHAACRSAVGGLDPAWRPRRRSAALRSQAHRDAQADRRLIPSNERQVH